MTPPDGLRPLPDFVTPMSGWSSARRRQGAASAVAILVPVTAIWLGFHQNFFFVSDADHYLELARGHLTMMPFASRQLAPLLVRGLARMLHVEIEQAFLLEGFLALLTMAAAAMWLVIHSGAPRWMLTAVAGLALWPQLLHGLALPDMVYGALIAGLLVLIAQRRWLAAALMFLPLTLARESTVLTLICFLAALWSVLRWRERACAVLAWAGGSALVGRLASHALPNRERLPAALYMLGKMPWNFGKNFLGLEPWANIYPACEAPRWSHPLHAGPVQAVGFCIWSLDRPLLFLALALTQFGLLPLLLAWVLRRDVSGQVRAAIVNSPLARFALVYGGVSWLIAGLLGDRVDRLLAYGWPLFVVAVPCLLAARGVTFRATWAATAWVLVSCTLSWLSLSNWPALMMASALAGYCLGAWLLAQRTVAIPTSAG